MILATIVRCENTRSKIEAIVEKEIGGYQTWLECYISLIQKRTPMTERLRIKNPRSTMSNEDIPVNSNE